MAPLTLNMQEPLSWKAGRAIPVADLLKRLQALSKELAVMDQDEEEDKEELMRPAKELAHSNLMSHKDKGVRAWTASCLVDMLRVFAPMAPYTGQQLKVRSCEPAASTPTVLTLCLGNIRAFRTDYHTSPCRPEQFVQ